MSKQDHSNANINFYFFSKPFIWVTSILVVASKAVTATPFGKIPNVFEDIRRSQQEYERLSASRFSGLDCDGGQCNFFGSPLDKLGHNLYRNNVFFAENSSKEKEKLPSGRCIIQNDIFYCRQ